MFEFASSADHGLSFLVGADAPALPGSPQAPAESYEVQVKPETLNDAFHKITISFVLLGLVTGVTIAFGGAIAQGVIGAVKKKA